MQELKARLAAIVDSSNDAIIGTDLNGAIVSWNHGAETIYGYKAAEVVGKSPSLTYSEEMNNDSELRRLLTNGGSLKHHESVRRCKNGRLVYVSMTASPIKTADGRVIGTSFIERDITERIRRENELKLAIEQAQAAIRAKGEFVANISHELRTPMNAIIGMLELSLKNGDLPATLADYLETARDSAHLLLSLVNDLLDFSRLEVGKFELDEQDFSLKKTVDDSLRALAMRANDHGLELAYRIDDNVPDILKGDPRRLRQILLNLVGNSIKFTEEGEVVVWIHVLKRLAGEVQLKISVSDTGIGIAPENLETVFQPFTQLDNSSTRKYAGAGLGLTICREFVELMRGEIVVDSQVGKGTTVHVTPWFSLGNAPLISGRERLQEIRGRRVLIVDDNRTNRLILEETLKLWEVETVSASSGREGLSLLAESISTGRTFDLVLIDALMPEMDGVSLIRRIRENETFPDLSVLMLSSADRLRLEKECNELAVSAFLEKPISETALLEAMVDSLSHLRPSLSRIPIPLRRTNRPLTILVAEDTIANQKVVRSILETRGHHVEVASNGKEAIEAVAGKKFDLVLMDVQMPTLDGLQATRMIRDDPRRSIADLPIIALTAHAMKGDRVRCLAAGMDGYLSKPFDADELIRMVETTSHLKNSQASLPMTQESISPEDLPPYERKTSESLRSTKFTGKDPVVDLQRALERLGGDVGLLRQMGEMYIEDIPGLLQELKSALQRQDAEEVTRSAHSISGLSSTFEAKQCCAVARSIEDAGKRKDLETAGELIPILQGEIDQVCQALKLQS